MIRRALEELRTWWRKPPVHIRNVAIQLLSESYRYQLRAEFHEALRGVDDPEAQFCRIASLNMATDAAGIYMDTHISH